METSSSVLKGPLSGEALGIFAAYLSELVGQPMELDLGEFATEVHETWGKYQYKVAGGKESNYQGIRLSMGHMEANIEIIWHNRINLVIRLSLGPPQVNDAICEDVKQVLWPSYGPVLREFMTAYDDLI